MILRIEMIKLRVAGHSLIHRSVGDSVYGRSSFILVIFALALSHNCKILFSFLRCSRIISLIEQLARTQKVVLSSSIHLFIYIYQGQKLSFQGHTY